MFIYIHIYPIYINIYQYILLYINIYKTKNIFSTPQSQKQKWRPHVARKIGENRHEFTGRTAQGGERDAADVTGGGRGHSSGQGLWLCVRNGISSATSGRASD